MARQKISEDAFQKQVIDLAHLLGWRVAHFRKVRVARKNGTVYYETPVAADGKGFLDLELVRERIIKAELKVGYNPTTPEQDEWIKSYKDIGVECYVWRPEDFDKIQAVLTMRSKRCQTDCPVEPPSMKRCLAQAMQSLRNKKGSK